MDGTQITTIDGANISTGTITADKITADGISADIIRAGTISVDRLPGLSNAATGTDRATASLPGTNTRGTAIAFATVTMTLSNVFFDQDYTITADLNFSDRQTRSGTILGGQTVSESFTFSDNNILNGNATIEINTNATLADVTESCSVIIVAQ